MIRGGILFLLWKKKEVTIENLKEVFDLQKIDENRREGLAKKFLKTPGFVQECFVGIVDNANTTFNGYFGILASYIDLL